MTTSLSEIDVRAVTLLWSVRVVTKKGEEEENKNEEKELDCGRERTGEEKINLQVSFPL